MSKKVRNFAPVFEREKVMEQAPSRAAPKHFPKSPGGGMVDAVDSKSAVSNGVGVQVPPGVLNGGHLTAFFCCCKYCVNQLFIKIVPTFVFLYYYPLFLVLSSNFPPNFPQILEIMRIFAK